MHIITLTSRLLTSSKHRTKEVAVRRLFQLVDTNVVLHKRCIQNSRKYLKWRVFIEEFPIVDICRNHEYTSIYDSDSAAMSMLGCGIAKAGVSRVARSKHLSVSSNRQFVSSNLLSFSGNT